MVVEYPGYGICPGVPSEASVNKNARACFRYVLEVLKAASFTHSVSVQQAHVSTRIANHDEKW